MPTTNDPTDPRLGHGSDSKPGPQNEAYLVLSGEDRAKGYVRPVRFSYRHIGEPGPKYPLRDLTDEEKNRFPDYVKLEPYPESELPKTSRLWTQKSINNIGKGCGTITSMNKAIAETYARDPHFYGSTYCIECGMHKPVSEFVWVDDGTTVGS